jgi:hypothetical protein
MVTVKSAIFNTLWYSVNVNITLYLDAKFNYQIILALNATNHLPSKIINALLKIVKLITILDVSHVNADITLQKTAPVLKWKKAALSTIEEYVLNVFLTLSSKEVHVWLRDAFHTRTVFVNLAHQIMNFQKESVHSKIVLIGKMTPVLYAIVGSIFSKGNVSRVLATSSAKDDHLWYCLILCFDSSLKNISFIILLMGLIPIAYLISRFSGQLLE